jgi:hypothetical protein
MSDSEKRYGGCTASYIAVDGTRAERELLARIRELEADLEAERFWVTMQNEIARTAEAAFNELEAERANERSVRVIVFRYLDPDYIWVEIPDGTTDNIIADNPIARLLAADLPAGPDGRRVVDVVVREVADETKGGDK